MPMQPVAVLGPRTVAILLRLARRCSREGGSSPFAALSGGSLQNRWRLPLEEASMAEAQAARGADMTRRDRSGWLAVVLTSLTAATLSAVAAVQSSTSQAPASKSPQAVPAMPRYGADGALQLPEDYRRWIFIGSSLGMSYSEGARGMEMFHETLMEPTAYKHFVDTGTFREGTMLALILHGAAERVPPMRQGRFATEVHGVEMAVKDSSHRAEKWAYYNFGGMSGLRATAQAMPKESCYNCHIQHAKRDNVFLQFYPMLAEAAHLSEQARPAADGGAAVSEPPAAAAASNAAAATQLALRGLDPVLLVEGREELGKPEIVATHGALRYQFVSEPNRARFAADPAAFSIRNRTCPVVPGAPIDPSLFAVYKKRIWGLATADCVTEFRARPADFAKPERQ
jgi:hypothetical protein